MKFRLQAMVLCNALLLFSGCSGGGSGGDQTVIAPPVVEPPDTGPKVITIEGPEQSSALQAALDQLAPGDTLIIRAGAGVYRSDALYPGELLRGFTLVNSGTAEAPIRIIGQAAEGIERPVFDQGKQGVHDPAAAGEHPQPTAGLYLACVSHVIIDNIEIRHAHSAGITTALNRCKSDSIRIENSYIHHIYGDRNVAGIRLSRAANVLVTGNVIHDIVQTDSDRSEALIAGTNSVIDNIRIEHNDFSAMATGIQIRSQRDKSVRDIHITHNRFHHLQTGIAAVVDNTGALSLADAAIRDIAVHDNVFFALDTGIDVAAANSQQQSDNLTIYNNTMIELSGPALSFAAVTDVRFYNNIVYELARDIVVSIKPVNDALRNSIAEYDYNLYWHSGYTAANGPEWLLDIGGDNEQPFASLQRWQQAYSDTLHPQLEVDPDKVSQFIDPIFTDTDTMDYRPSASFALGGGRNGETLGAYRNGMRPGVQ